jgi:RNA polymerase sigma factor (sigma-70 family)
MTDRHSLHDEASPASRGKALLEAHYDLIQRKIQHLSRRGGLPDHEAEEFRSWAVFKLVEDDYRILGSWEGRSTLKTYLAVVLVNLMRDYRTQVWGKWRPSAAARRQGRAGMLLERLWVRDGLSFEEASERLRTEHGIHLSPAELERIAARLPRRPARRRVGEKVLYGIPVDGQVESRVEGAEQARTRARLRRALQPLLRGLSAENRRLLELYYRDDLSMAAIAPLVGKSQRELYALRDRCLKALRRSLESLGLTSDRVTPLLGSSRCEIPTNDESLWE